MSTRRGAMLLEVVLALAITALVLAGGGTALRTLSLLLTNVRGVQATEELGRTHEQFLRSVGRMANRLDSAQFVFGDGDSITFPSSCMTARGWEEPCRVAIATTDEPQARNTAAFQVTGSNGSSFSFGRGAGSIRYLIDARNGGVWQSTWQDTTKLPLAIELVAQRESLFIRFGWGGR